MAFSNSVAIVMWLVAEHGTLTEAGRVLFPFPFIKNA